GLRLSGLCDRRDRAVLRLRRPHALAACSGGCARLMKEETNGERVVANTPRRSVATVRSEDLFDGSRELIIRHATEEYRLRITRATKLTLAKQPPASGAAAAASQPRTATVPHGGWHVSTHRRAPRRVHLGTVRLGSGRRSPQRRVLLPTGDPSACDRTRIRAPRESRTGLDWPADRAARCARGPDSAALADRARDPAGVPEPARRALDGRRGRSDGREQIPRLSIPRLSRSGRGRLRGAPAQRLGAPTARR